MLLSAGAEAQTVAGRQIVNIATATFVVDGRPGSAESNAATDQVGELLGVGAKPLLDGPTPAADGERDRAVAFRLTNVGNGREAFALSAFAVATGEAAKAPSCGRIAVDRDGDGAFSAQDEIYVPGAEPVLNPGASIVAFALCDVPDDAVDGQQTEVRFAAAALTGAGEPGTVFIGRGDDGVDALVGVAGAVAEAQTRVVVELGRPELIKAQSVRDPEGGARVVAGSRVTYTLTARVAGRGVARDVSIQDSVPVGAVYVPGTLSLDGAPLSDAADEDPGRFTGQAVEIVLGQLEPRRDRTVSFQVQIQ